MMRHDSGHRDTEIRPSRGRGTSQQKIQSLNVDSYVGDPKSTINLAAQFASLPDGTNYVSQTVHNAPPSPFRH
jgi:hypothetical protein